MRALGYTFRRGRRRHERIEHRAEKGHLNISAAGKQSPELLMRQAPAGVQGKHMCSRLLRCVWIGGSRFWH